MTNGACQTACLAAGYKIAGTEYGGECCKCLKLLTLTSLAKNFRVRKRCY